MRGKREFWVALVCRYRDRILRSLGARYLHHGQAQSLQELLEDPAWQEHLTAGNAVFLSGGDVEQQRSDLRQYLLSIDATTTEHEIPDGFDACPAEE